MSLTRRVFQVALPALIVAGCGDDPSPFFTEDGVGAPPASSLLPITATNAPDAARESYYAAARSMDILDVAVQVGQNLGGGIAKPSGPSLNTGGLADVVRMAPFGPSVIGCPNGGTVTISGDVATPTALSAGDTVNLFYEACNGGLNVVNGTVDTTVDQYREDAVLAENFALALSMDITNYQVTTNGVTETTNGDSSVFVDTLGAPGTVAASVAGSATTFDGNSRSTTLTNYATSETFTLNGEVYRFSVDARGTINSTVLDSPVTYSTPVRLEGVEGGYPTSGELLVTGAGSSVRLVAIDGANVRIDVDANGEGEVDVAVDSTWVAILGN